ncbi:heme-thiolate peroxidase HTP8 [Teratosphaeria destructans]|uniref:Heme-thiolate peroxidase HTP8 n=1 Tax=Teratosphaeria destructans TaxID=418781 RepID=A0A9W7W5P1_9PEZI|nr:heme-thiolate peroxidase HTP8 [Teratosphaeria destructans]
MRYSIILAAASTAAAFCPMAELSRRGLAPEAMKKEYLAGRGLGTPGQKRQDNPPPIADPISGVLSPLGLGSLTPRSPRSAEHNAAIEEHVRSRLEERDEDVNIDAKILTPKAHKRHVAERGLVGGLLAPLSGPLAALDIPTPQDSGLKAIPGDDPNHQYQPPGPTDVRGDCPTLNTLANHGYLSRDGITSFAEAANAIQEAYSMSFDIAVFLSVLGLLAGGDIPTGKYSIGGQDSRVPETLGQPVYGIDRHGLFEIDASISRGDRYFGDNHSFNITRWNKLVDDANNYGDGLFNVDAVKNNAAEAVEASRAENPEFTMGGNFAVIYATRALLSRPLANGTEPNTPDFQNIAPFYLNETFPEYWYRIPDSYSLVDLLGDIGDFFLYKPQPLGRNYNGAFVPLNISIPQAPAQIGCLGASLLASAAPDEAEEVVQAVNALKDQILVPVLGAAACDISEYEEDGGQAYYESSNEDVNGGSGSGITHLGEFDALTVKPSGLSSGQPVRRRSRSARFA